MSDRNLNLQQRSLAERSKDILLGYPLANWSDNLAQLHTDFLAQIEELDQQLADAQKDSNRLDYVLSTTGFIVSSYEGFELTVQDEDEDFHVRGIGKTHREAIDDAITKESK